MSKETGGPAFPVPDSEYQIQDTGMTLRDYLAAKAMQGMLANGIALGEIPLYAYEIADAMLAVRGQ
ncbi:hypothetical protein ACOMDP_11825 [Pantoea dispersa]|uniref:hypothetical protein n=1 Tax=Pantoea dispersa TaxID=59814 RepID=UPI003B78719B